MDHDHLYKFSILSQQKVPNEVGRKLAQGFCRRSFKGVNRLTAGQQTASDHKSSSRAKGSGELKITCSISFRDYLMHKLYNFLKSTYSLHELMQLAALNGFIYIQRPPKLYVPHRQHMDEAGL